MTTADTFQLVPLDDIFASGQQRKRFAAADLATLAGSIEAIGLAEPIVVRPHHGGRMELVAGERRFRAFSLLRDAGKAGFDSIPAFVRVMDDRRRRAVQAAENLARADLNPIEEAETYAELMADGLTIEEAAVAVGVTAHRAKTYLPLTKLDPRIAELVRAGQLSHGFAYAITGHPATLDSNRQMRALAVLQQGDLSCAELTSVVQRLLGEQQQDSMFGDDDFMVIEEYVTTARKVSRPGVKALAALVRELADAAAAAGLDSSLVARARSAADAHQA